MASASDNTSVAAQPLDLRGSYAGTQTPREVRVWRPGDSEAYVLSPVMVQIMASMDDGMLRLAQDDATSERRRPAL